MDNSVMLSIHPEWLEMIFNEEKGLEFRNKIISTIKPETRIYFYETKKNNGIGKVVGDAIIADVQRISEEKKELYSQCFNYIGYTSQDYVIRLIAVQKYAEPLNIQEFEYLSGNTIKNPPQGIVNVRRK